MNSNEAFRKYAAEHLERLTEEERNDFSHCFLYGIAWGMILKERGRYPKLTDTTFEEIMNFFEEGM